MVKVKLTNTALTIGALTVNTPAMKLLSIQSNQMMIAFTSINIMNTTMMTVSMDVIKSYSTGKEFLNILHKVLAK